MFIGAFDQATPWSDRGVKGLLQVLGARMEFAEYFKRGRGATVRIWRRQCIRPSKGGRDIERMKFNTAIATLMSLVNDFTKKGERDAW